MSTLSNAAKTAQFSAQFSSKVKQSFRAAVLLQICSASKAVEYLRSTAETGFSDYLQALATVNTYESRRCNDVSFILNTDIAVNDAVKRLDLKNAGDLNGSNILPAIKRYMVTNLTPKAK
jgi:hypothetical protein